MDICTRNFFSGSLDIVYDDIPPEFAVYGPGPNVVYLVTFAIDWPHSFTNVTEKVRNEFPAISHMEIS